MNAIERAVVIFVLAAILLMALVIAFASAQSKSAPVTCVSAEDRERIQRLTTRAIDAAFQEHVRKLFSIWVTDYSPEPTRAKVGMQNGISAYIRARAMQLPPVC